LVILLDWCKLLPRDRKWRSLDSPYLGPGEAKRIWDLWGAGAIGFAYPFSLEVLVRNLERLG
jgi:hypothetical protein